MFPSSNMQASNGKPNTQRIEAIKAYYNQLCTNLRHIVNQLNAPEVTPQRRLALQGQQEQVQKSLAEFTEKVLRPLASAAGGANPATAVGSTSQHSSGNPGNLLIPQSSPPSSATTATNGKFPGAPFQPQQHPAGSTPQHQQQAAAANVVLFPFAPPAIKQMATLYQKQMALVHQQQQTFHQKVHNKHFDSSFGPSKKEADVPANLTKYRLVSHEDSKPPSSMLSNEAAGRAGPQTVNGLVAEMYPNVRLDRTLEQAVLRMADDFVDEVGSFACQLALHRKDTKLCKRDVELALHKSSAQITLPGSYRSVVLGASVKKLTKRQPSSSNQHQNRMTQLKKFMASQQNM